LDQTFNATNPKKEREEGGKKDAGCIQTVFRNGPLSKGD